MQGKAISKGGIIWKWDLKWMQVEKKKQLFQDIKSIKPAGNLDKWGEALYK